MPDEIKEIYWSRFKETYDLNQEYVVGIDLLNEVKLNISKINDLGNVLELGCGTGYFTTTIVKKARHLFTTDLSDELLENAKIRLTNIEQITVQKENCYNTSFESEKFDTVFMANLIHIVKEPAKVLRECFRVLKEDGSLIVTSFTYYSMKPTEIIKLVYRYIKVWGKPPKHIYRFTPESLDSLIISAGFVIEETKILGNKTKSVFVIGRKKIKDKND